MQKVVGENCEIVQWYEAECPQEECEGFERIIVGAMLEPGVLVEKLHALKMRCYLCQRDYTLGEDDVREVKADYLASTFLDEQIA